MKARIIVAGNVQGVGYRALVKQVARRLNIKGIARNLEDGTVEVFCECSPEILEKFVSFIDVKGDAKEAFSVNVEKIDVYKEGEKGYVAPREELKTFDVDYSMELTPFEKESLERSEIGALLLLDTRKDIKTMHHDLKGELIGIRKDIKQEFNAVRTDYGKISVYIEKILETMAQDRKDFRDAIERLAKAIESKK